MTRRGPSMVDLAARSLARQCVLCGKPACVCCPGSDAVYRTVVRVRPDGSTVRHRRLVSAAVADVDLCLADAAARWGGGAPAKPQRRVR